MQLKERARNIRKRIIREAYRRQCSHVGSCLSCVEILTVLFFEIMKPEDKFILSAGHKASALYSTLVEKGILKEEEMASLAEHPEKNLKLGIEHSTGSLGHGLPLACGSALGGRNTFVLLSDGDFQEGSTLEAFKFILQTPYIQNKICVIADFNSWSAYSHIEYDPRWNLIDGHNFKEIKKNVEMFWFVGCKTIKSKGIKEWEDKLESHYLKITKEIYEKYI